MTETLRGMHTPHRGRQLRCRAAARKVRFAPLRIEGIGGAEVRERTLFHKFEVSGMDIFEKLKRERPVIHILTNYVTARDVVNIVLAAGASGICADAPEEAAEITAISKGLLINIGTPSDRKAQTYLLSGKKANEIGIPVVLDPVGVGASEFRKRIVRDLLENVHFSCIRGNMSEMEAIAEIAGIAAPAENGKDHPGQNNSQGVETAITDVPVQMLKKISEKYNTVILATGPVDYIVDGENVRTSASGTKLEKRVTGSGCMFSGFLTAVLSAAGSADRKTESGHEKHISYGEAAFLASEKYGEAAKIAEAEMRASGHIGTGTFVTFLTDAISRIPGV